MFLCISLPSWALVKPYSKFRETRYELTSEFNRQPLGALTVSSCFPGMDTSNFQDGGCLFSPSTWVSTISQDPLLTSEGDTVCRRWEIAGCLCADARTRKKRAAMNNKVKHVPLAWELNEQEQKVIERRSSTEGLCILKKLFLNSKQ